MRNLSGIWFWLINKKRYNKRYSFQYCLPNGTPESTVTSLLKKKKMKSRNKKHQPKPSVFPCLHCWETSSLFVSNAVVLGYTLPKPGGGLATTVLSVTCDEGVFEVCSCGWEDDCVVVGWDWGCCCGKESEEFQRSNTKTNETKFFFKTWSSYLRAKVDWKTNFSSNIGK